jgi:hypothetical protein
MTELCGMFVAAVILVSVAVLQILSRYCPGRIDKREKD